MGVTQMSTSKATHAKAPAKTIEIPQSAMQDAGIVDAVNRLEKMLERHLTDLKNRESAAG
jgi:hypothetical protein